MHELSISHLRGVSLQTGEMLPMPYCCLREYLQTGRPLCESFGGVNKLVIPHVWSIWVAIVLWLYVEEIFRSFPFVCLVNLLVDG